MGLLLIVLSILSGCRAEGYDKTEQMTLKENEYRIYCLNREGTGLAYYIREAKAKEQAELIDELLSFLAEDAYDFGYQCAIEKTVTVEKVEIVDDRVYVYFSKEYQNADSVKEALIQAAVVKTLVQTEGISKVCFYVKDNERYIMSGYMTAADFIDDTTDIVMDNNKINIQLYFTDEQGMELYAESREVYIDTVSSKEKIVLNQLLQGPESDDLRKVLPEGLTILSVVTRNGICYLDMDDTFLTGTINVVDAIPVYAIVNSLTAIDGVDEVQILINGEAGKAYRGVISLDAPLTAKMDLVAQNRR